MFRVLHEKGRNPGVDDETFHVQVNIPSLSSWRNNRRPLRSPVFVRHGCYWFAEVDPISLGLTCHQRYLFVGFYLRYKFISSPVDLSSTTVIFRMIDPQTNNEIPNFIKKYHWTTLTSEKRRLQCFGSDFFIGERDLWCESDVLKLRVELRFPATTLTPLQETQSPTVSSQGAALLNPWSRCIRPPKSRSPRLYKSGVGRDFVLVSSDGTERRVHKDILNGASPVFERMFQSNTKECQTGRYVMQDVSVENLDILLCFIYFGSVEKVESNAKEVLIEAHKYELVDLKTVCEEILMTRITMENVKELLFISEQVSAINLKQAVLSHIADNTNPARKIMDEIVERAIKFVRPDLVKDLVKRYFTVSKDTNS